MSAADSKSLQAQLNDITIPVIGFVKMGRTSGRCPNTQAMVTQPHTCPDIDVSDLDAMVSALAEERAA